MEGSREYTAEAATVLGQICLKALPKLLPHLTCLAEFLTVM